MIEGDSKVFAIESAITKAYGSKSNYALGCFILHVNGHAYGVHSSEASLLACSVNEVRERLVRRGKHIASFSEEPNAGLIADSFRHAIYAPNQDQHCFFNIPHSRFIEIINSRHLLWAPDGDEAFDDGSFIIQFDINDNVRLVAFKSKIVGYGHDPKTLADIMLPANRFYNILDKWQDAFEREWEYLLRK